MRLTTSRTAPWSPLRQRFLHGVPEQLFAQPHCLNLLHSVGELIFAEPAIVASVNSGIAEVHQLPNVPCSRHTVFVVAVVFSRVDMEVGDGDTEPLQHVKLRCGFVAIHLLGR